MPVTYDDVVRCYATFLGRKPETEDIVDFHIAQYSSIWEMITDMMDSHEFMTTLKGRNHLSLKKCYDGDYLAKSFDRKTAVACFLHHQRVLHRQLAPHHVEKILFEELTILQKEVKGVRFEVAIFATKDVLKEGELALELKVEDQPLYRLSFSFMSGDAIGLTNASQGLLISRMQGHPGKWAEIRDATKRLREVSPQSLLFSVLEGIGQAAQSDFIAGVSAANHIAPDKDKNVFERVYDNFFQSVESATRVGEFYVIDLPIQQKPLSMIAAMHRVRSRKKREFRSGIAAAAMQAWSSWRSDEVDAFILATTSSGQAPAGLGRDMHVEIGGMEAVQQQ